jgi:F420-non-reducing hydrogenase iron-sulfur subunit
MKTFEPKLVAFCCNYCAYAAADLSGSMRIQYPPNVRIIKTPCTGRLEARFLMRAFEKGADGVLVAGCLEGGCHFIEGNLFAKKRVNYTRNMLAELGLEEDRLRMVNISASMGRPFTELVTEMIETVRKLGPSPLNEIQNPESKVQTATG